MFFYRISSIVVLIFICVTAQGKIKADSLLKAAAACKGEVKDTALIDLMNEHSVRLRKKSRYDTAMILATLARQMALPFSKSANAHISAKGKKEVSYALITIGNIYLDQGKYPESLEMYFQAEKIKEEIHDESGLAACLNNIGNIFDVMGNKSEALKYYNEAKTINEKLGNKNFLSKNYNNIGGIYQQMKKYDLALENYQTSLKLKQEIDDKIGMCLSLDNIGYILELRGNYEEAIGYYLKALETQRSISDKKGIANTLNRLADVYLRHKKVDLAKKYADEALAISLPLGVKTEIKRAYQSIARADSLRSDFKSSNLHYHLYIAYLDSLQNEVATEKILEQKMQFEFDKKEALAKLEEEKRSELMTEEFKRQKQLRNFFLAGFVLVLIVAVYAFYAYIQKRKNHKLLEDKNRIIEQKQKEILDSIHYAKRIQSSSLPSEIFIERSLRELKPDQNSSNKG